MPASLLALTASGCWGVADYLGGVASRRNPLLTVLVVSQTAGLATLLLVLAVRGQGPPLDGVAAGIAAGALGVVAISSFYRSMAIGTISVVAPILATSVMVPVVVGLLTGDHPSHVQLAGIAVAIAGVVLVSIEPGGSSSEHGRLAVGLALLAMAALGFQLVALDSGASHDALWTVAVGRATSLTVFALAALVTRPAMAAAAAPGLALIGIIDTGANSAFALAAAEGLLSVVAVLASLYPVITVGLAHLRLGERLAPLQAAGVVAALAGVAMITAGG
jgi:drug/metabolite transporter (DMT)-like permease